MSQLLTDDALAAIGVDIAHHFAPGVYVKASRIAAGSPGLTKHTHDYTHLSVLVSGTVKVNIGGVDRILSGFHVLTVEAGVPHKVTAITDAIWLCIHATDDTNPNTVDVSLMSKVAKE